MPDLIPDLLRLARLSNTAYIDAHDEQVLAAAVLGYRIIDLYANADHRALLCLDPVTQEVTLALCGTRFSDANVHELFDDEDVIPVDLGGGRHVMAGFHVGMADLYDWAVVSAPVGTKFKITGHSLGGARAHMAPIFMPPAAVGQITSFAAPKAANKAYWNSVGDLGIRRVVNKRDLWAGYPWIGEWCQQEPMLWLDGHSIQSMHEAQWKGGLCAADHSITDGYIANLAVLTSTPQSPG